MMENMVTMLWKEWKEYMIRSSNKTDNFLMLIGFPAFMVMFFGLYYPWSTGSIILGSFFSIMGYLILPVVYVMALVMESFIGERRDHTLETLLASCIPDDVIVTGKVVAAFGYVSISLLASFATGLTVIALSRGALALFNSTMILELCIFTISLMVCLLTAFISALSAMKAQTIMDAQLRFIAIVFSLVITAVIAPLAIFSVIPEGWKNIVINVVTDSALNILIIGIALLLALNFVFYKISTGSFKRTKMIDL